MNNSKKHSARRISAEHLNLASFYSSTAVKLLFALGLSFTSAATAGEITISNGQTVGFQSLADGDVLIVEKGGIVTETNVAVKGPGFGTTVNVVNNGLIQSTAGAAIDVEGSTLNLINKTGALIRSDDNPIIASLISSFENRGTIIANTRGVHALNYMRDIFNSGTITTNGKALSAGDGIIKLVNTGTISGTLMGVSSGGHIGRFYNSGVIYGGTHGIFANGSFGHLINSGAISGDVGIQANRVTAGGNEIVITNSGTITSTATTGSRFAIDLQLPGADTINLNAGSVINGAIKLDGEDDVINMGRGLNAEITVTSLPDATFGTGLGVRTGLSVIQVDPSASLAIGDMTNDVVGAVSNNVHSRIGSFNPSYDNPGHEFGYGKFGEVTERSAWASTWGTGSTIDAYGSVVKTTSTNGGFVGGVDWLNNTGDLFGVLASVGAGKINTNVVNGHVINNKSFMGGVYGRKIINDVFVDYNIAGGLINFNNERKVTTFNGLKTAAASYNGILFAPNITLSKEVGDFKPSVGFGYNGLFINSYTETGTTHNAFVGSRKLHLVKAKAQVEIIRDFADRNGRLVKFRPYLGVEGAIGFGDWNNSNLTVASTDINFDSERSNKRIRGFAGVNFSKAFTDEMTFFGNAELAYSNSNSVSGTVSMGLSRSF